MVSTVQYDDSAASYFMLMICSLYVALAGLYTYIYLQRRSVDPLSLVRIPHAAFHSKFEYFHDVFVSNAFIVDCSMMVAGKNSRGTASP